ncbi:hypothetical protein RIF29_11903 [Crotalaria pallida]|uniref:Uncharacterized protein n=1 Tax=Crotalaria pallida TaxID=3830 RepID=A0AAN9IMN1_CROPI
MQIKRKERERREICQGEEGEAIWWRRNNGNSARGNEELSKYAVLHIISQTNTLRSTLKKQKNELPDSCFRN